MPSYSEFLRVAFGSFSGGGSVVGGEHERVSREVKDLQRTLQERVDARRRDLALGLHSDIRWVKAGGGGLAWCN